MEQVTHSVDYKIFEAKWLPCSDKFIVTGYNADVESGILEIFEHSESELKMVKRIKKKAAFRYGSFGASSLKSCHYAFGDCNGSLNILDLERPEVPVFKTRKYNCIINSIDAVGGNQINNGAPEIVTGSSDGYVRVWDTRVERKPVIALSPELATGYATRHIDCWAVKFADLERSVVAGYSNGDLKLSDFRNFSVAWETTEKNAIVSIDIDRNISAMSKIVVTTLKGGLIAHDLRTQHSQKLFPSLPAKGLSNRLNRTIWNVKHLPQYRDIFVTCDGLGSIRLWEYEYSNNRRQNAGNNYDKGVPWTINMLNERKISEKSVTCFDWNPHKAGLGLCGVGDDTVRVLDTTKINLG